MRIGHYAPKLWARGGIATYVRRLGQAQEQAGHEVFYFSRTSAGEDAPDPQRVITNDHELFGSARDLNLDVLHLHKPVDHLPEERVLTVRTMHGNQGSCPSGTRYLKRSGQPCHRAYSISGCLWGHLIDHCGSRRPHKAYANFKSIQREQRLAAALPTLTVSQFLKDQMIRSGCPPENLYVLRSPAPDPRSSYTPPPREGLPRFVFLGRITPQKGIDWLLRAAARVPEELRIDIAGEGNPSYVRTLQEQATELGIDSQTTFHGWLDDAAVFALLQKARAVVVPSVWHEPAGLVTLEAAALGRPVIGSKVGGLPEYATEDFALLAPPRDVDALAQHITCLASDKSKAEQMGRRGLHAAHTKFALSSFINKLHQFYTRFATADRASAQRSPERARFS